MNPALKSQSDFISDEGDSGWRDGEVPEGDMYDKALYEVFKFTDGQLKKINEVLNLQAVDNTNAPADSKFWEQSVKWKLYICLSRLKSIEKSLEKSLEKKNEEIKINYLSEDLSIFFRLMNDLYIKEFYYRSIIETQKKKQSYNKHLDLLLGRIRMYTNGYKKALTIIKLIGDDIEQLNTVLSTDKENLIIQIKVIIDILSKDFT